VPSLGVLELVLFLDQPVDLGDDVLVVHRFEGIAVLIVIRRTASYWPIAPLIMAA
jgi:hypothetical protein